MDYICQEYAGEESGQESEEEVEEITEYPIVSKSKKRKSLEKPMESRPLSFTEEDLSYFVTRVSVENQERMKGFLRAENGQMSGIIYKMIESRLMAQNGKLNKLIKRIDGIDKALKDLDNKIDKTTGMSKFSYAWCKSAQEAGIFKLKQKY